MLRSTTKAIQIAALAKTTDISEYGIDKVLEPIKEDIAKLEKVYKNMYKTLHTCTYMQGVEFETRNGKLTLKGALVTVSADNLGSHAVGGFKGSCTAKRPCRQCMTPYEEFKDKVHVSLAVPVPCIK